ncbi:MAG: VacJ family lipoprotein [Gammaproteobacteria bacterium]|nr:VacJ family lipoprotein [Gammaproteobacteria bacterium]MCP5135592.1 VacJ family lipoprotein [Gammaproteobacteria bacterium]
MLRKLLLLFVAGSVLSGCATGPNAHPEDPLEPLNRGIYSFNETFDRALMKPVSQAYKAVTPDVVDKGVTNFFNNIDDVSVMINNVLQLKLVNALSDLSRIMVNTSFGILGVFDVATMWGLEKHDEDFGQTLGYWGMGTGPYLVLPIFGPSNVRDGVGFVAEWYIDPVAHVHPERDRWVAVILRAIDTRADLLTATDVLDEVAYDPYQTLRDSYLQRRAYLVADGAETVAKGGFSEDDLLLDAPPPPPAK